MKIPRFFIFLFFFLILFLFGIVIFKLQEKDYQRVNENVNVFDFMRKYTNRNIGFTMEEIVNEFGCPEDFSIE
jgi:hypothetical protein